MITTNQKSDLLDRISQVCAQLAETKASLESVDPQDEAAITAHQRVIHRILNGFIEKPVEFIPAGESTLWRVPVTSDATISGTALVRADSLDDAVEVACRMAMQGKVVMTIDDGNHRRLDDFYCPDEDGVEFIEPEPQPV